MYHCNGRRKRLLLCILSSKPFNHREAVRRIKLHKYMFFAEHLYFIHQIVTCPRRHCENVTQPVFFDPPKYKYQYSGGRKHGRKAVCENNSVILYCVMRVTIVRSCIRHTAARALQSLLFIVFSCGYPAIFYDKTN